jgi:hypothetical protein
VTLWKFFIVVQKLHAQKKGGMFRLVLMCGWLCFSSIRDSDEIPETPWNVCDVEKQKKNLMVDCSH